MAFDFDIRYIKGNAIPHVDVLSGLHFKRGQKDSILENMEYEFLHCIDTDVLPLNQLGLRNITGSSIN